VKKGSRTHPDNYSKGVGGFLGKGKDNLPRLKGTVSIVRRKELRMFWKGGKGA